MTLAGTLTVMVSLALAGGVLLLSRWVNNGTDVIKGGVRPNVIPDSCEAELLFRTVRDTRELKATVTVGSGASPGPRPVNVVNPDGGQGTCGGCFTVS